MTRFHLASSSPLLIALALNLAACVVDKDLGDTPGDSSGATTTATTTGTTDPGTGTTDPTEGVPALCPGNPLFTCSVAFTCMDFPCGGLQDRLDADGCPRLPCDADEPCPAGQVCYETGVWGGCNASGVFCEQEGLKCSCSMSLDCQDVSYCVPADIGPPLDCGAITDAQACEDAGCSEASTVVPVTVVDDACVCGEPELACLWFEPGDEVGSTASPAPFYRKSDLEVVIFPGDWFDPPHGWASCAGDLAAPPACACAETCSP